MRVRLVFTVAVILVVGHLDAQDRAPSEPYQSRVEVLAFQTDGSFIGAPEVRLFESADHESVDQKDFAKKFRAGVADNIPFGIYKLTAYTSGFYSETRYVAVFQHRVTVVVGLRFGRELATLPIFPVLRGTVSGPTPADKRRFVKLVGLYSSQSLESSIGPDGSFELTEPREGRYLLLVVAEDGILASRPVDIPYTGPALRIEVGVPAPVNGRR